MIKKTVIKESEAITDKTAKKLLEILEHQHQIQKIRRSHVITTISGTAGLVMLFDGMEKIFTSLSGWASIVIGVILLVISGTLVSKLK